MNIQIQMIESILSTITSTLLLIFTYIIPLFSSIRTIHNRDIQSYNQWLTYWLLISLISPFLTYIHSYYKTFTLSFILWLSLPRFQGATIIYEEIVCVYIVDKYQMDVNVEKKMDTVKSKLRNSLWNIMQDVGWGVLYQIGGVVSFVQDYTSSTFSTTNSSNVSVNVSATAITNDSDYSDKDGVQNNNHDSTSIKSPISKNTKKPKLQQIPSISASKINHKTRPVHSVMESFSSLSSIDTTCTSTTATTTSTTTSTTSTKSTKSSLSSSSTISNTTTQHSNNSKTTTISSSPTRMMNSNNSNKSPSSTSFSEQQSYIHDFLTMLQKGLYVFAWHGNSHLITLTDRNGNAIHDDNENTTSIDRFRLRVFTFIQDDGEDGEEEVEEEDDNNNNDRKQEDRSSDSNNNNDDDDDDDTNMNKNNGQKNENRRISYHDSYYQNGHFVLSSVESRPDEEGIDIVSFPIHVVTEIKESSRGIQFLSSKNKIMEQEEHASVVDCDDHRSAATVTTSTTRLEKTTTIPTKSTTSPPKSSSSPSSSRSPPHHKNNDILLAEIVLSDDKDRNILLFGLRTILFGNVE